MSGFLYRSGELLCDGVPAAKIAAGEGTPCWVYSRALVEGAYRDIANAFRGLDPLVCYSLKANANLALLKILAGLGSGFDVVSRGEMFRLVRTGIGLSRAVFAGVGKTDEEIRYALENELFLFNVESEAELRAISEVASAAGRKASVALRLNPGVDPDTHDYIATGKKGNKFGIEIEEAWRIVARRSEYPGALLRGIHTHIGSQILSSDPYGEALSRVLPFAAACRRQGVPLECLNAGGGFGISYDREAPADLSAVAKALAPVKSAGLRLLLEPGRWVVGNAGLLLARVVYVKESAEKRFLIVDAAMNDLIRPALYGSYHRILPVRIPGAEGAPAAVAAGLASFGPLAAFDVVGPVCESGDFLAKGRELPAGLARGDVVAVFGAGAYGFAMSSNYNSRPRAAELLAENGTHRVVRRREGLEDLVKGELEEEPGPG